MFWVAIAYSLTYFIPVSKSLSVWTNNLSHVFAVPAILLDFPKIISVSVLVATVASVLFHATDTFGYKGDWLRRLDHGLSVYLMFLTIAKVWYSHRTKTPAITQVLLVISGALPAALLTKPRVYPPMGAFAFVLATIVYLYKHRTPNLDKVYILFTLALLIRLLPTNSENRGHVHSIWHALAFTAVYYAIKYHYSLFLFRYPKQIEFPCKWIFVVFGIYMLLFVTYLSYNTPYTLDTNVSGTCGTLHCGTCGACSNQHDYEVYVNTSQTLTDDARNCALGGIFGHDEQVCLEKTGLSTNCTKCWVQNMQCTKKHCLFPCMWELVHPVSGMGRCLGCDEYHCVGEFLGCAGMSRRRAGVVSDIPRDNEELCSL